MEQSSKLKSLDEHGPIVGLLLGIVMIVIFGFIWNIYGENTVDKIAGIILGLGGIINFWVYYRTKNFGYFYFSAWQLSMAVRLLFNFEDPLVVTLYRIELVILLLIFFYMVYKKKLKGYYKNILELAAQPVDSTEDGFTSRPYPVGNIEYSPHEIFEFGKHCAKNLIAMPYLEDNKIILVISVDISNDIILARKNYLNTTYVSFDKDGKVEVNIAEKDYKKYKDELTFDHLCASLGNLFIEFLKLFRENNSGEIIKRLNQARK